VKISNVNKELEILRSIEEMRSYGAQRPLGLVPTMGYLHEGHLSLARRARKECETVVISIFVNPMQFAPAEDLDRYPRDEAGDLELAREVGADVVFIPDVGEIYPDGFTTEVRVRGLEDVLEGASRPGHFTGVATVLAKLLNIVGPDRMYMGQKDAQQAVIVRRMIEDLDFPTRLVVCPTVRESDGLAMSSRNVYLNDEERLVAPILYQALCKARDSGNGDSDELEEMVRRIVTSEPLIELEYVFAVDSSTLAPAWNSSEILLSLAAQLGKTRLIDNVLIVR
jgi:pantoate--beta-alanine ligase